MWIFTTSPKGQLSLALEMFGNAVILRGTSSHGFRDFATSSHFSAYEQIFLRVPLEWHQIRPN